MNTLSNLLVGLIGVEHVYILVLEMFLWTKPYGRRVFGNTPERAEMTKVMAQNQGLYNGFLAAGFFWALSLGNGPEGWHAKLFFAICVLVAGIYGGVTTQKRSILFLQSGPALLALIALVLAGV
jgi:putative membrane protein